MGGGGIYNILLLYIEIYNKLIIYIVYKNNSIIINI